MKVIPLSEGGFTVDKTKQFKPFDKETDDLQLRSPGSLLVEVQPFLVLTEKDIILIDSGLGFKDNKGFLQLHNNLAKHGIAPDDVTKVLLSHLHKDHAGGISNGSSLSFPNASYYINKQEFDHAFDHSSSSYITEDFLILKNSPQLVLLENSGFIDSYITYEMTNAHSLYHQVFWIKDEGKIVFFGGDVAPQLQQMKSRFIAKYDHDGRKSMELRKQWWEKGLKEDWIFLFYHDIKNPQYPTIGSYKKAGPK